MDDMTYVNGKLLTWEYFDYLKEKERFEGKLEAVEKIMNLTDHGMDVWRAIEYVLKELKREEEKIRKLSKYV